MKNEQLESDNDNAALSKIIKEIGRLKEQIALLTAQGCTRTDLDLEATYSEAEQIAERSKSNMRAKR